MSQLHETLIELLESIKQIQASLAKLESRSFKTPNEKPIDPEPIKMRIIDEIEEHWQVHKVPVTFNVINRRHNRTASQMGGLHAVIGELEESNQVFKFKNFSGSSTFLMPFSIYIELDYSLKQKLFEIGMTEMQIAKFKASKQNIATHSQELESTQEERETELENLDLSGLVDTNPREMRERAEKEAQALENQESQPDQEPVMDEELFSNSEIENDKLKSDSIVAPELQDMEAEFK